MRYGRKSGDMIQAYKILKKIDRIDPSKFFIQTKYKRTRSHSMKLFKPRFESELKRHAFSQRIIDDWNSLNWENSKFRVIRHFQGQTRQALEHRMV